VPVPDDTAAAPRFDPEPMRFAWTCTRVAIASFVIATIAAVDPSPGWLVVVGGYAFSVLLAAVAGLIALNELERDAREPRDESVAGPALLPAAPPPLALLPPAPTRLLLERPRPAAGHPNERLTEHRARYVS
jgi:hypothetical protein